MPPVAVDGIDRSAAVRAAGSRCLYRVAIGFVGIDRHGRRARADDRTRARSRPGGLGPLCLDRPRLEGDLGFNKLINPRQVGFNTQKIGWYEDSPYPCGPQSIYYNCY